MANAVKLTRVVNQYNHRNMAAVTLHAYIYMDLYIPFTIFLASIRKQIHRY